MPPPRIRGQAADEVSGGSLLIQPSVGGSSQTKQVETIKKLVSGYCAVRFEFEVFEYGRKLALVCMPVFFPPGSNAQLIFDLMVC